MFAFYQIKAEVKESEVSENPSFEYIIDVFSLFQENVENMLVFFESGDINKETDFSMTHRQVQ
jgi:hypothetical protein